MRTFSTTRTTILLKDEPLPSGAAVCSFRDTRHALEIRAQLLDSPAKGALKLLPPARLDVPPPEELEPLPEKYREYIGKHAAHPGEGKGRMGDNENSRRRSF